MMKLAIVVVAMLSVPLSAYANDPRNKSECLTALAKSLKTECRRIYAEADQAQMQEQCLNAIATQLDPVCEQFFGPQADFCATCNKGCTDHFPSGSDHRKECLTMCLNHSGC